MNPKTIGNTLTSTEFNTIQYLTNKGVTKTITIPISETINTEYGVIKTTFGTKHYKRKNGFITDTLKMKITNTLFESVSFKVVLQYRSVNNDLLDNDDDILNTVTYTLTGSDTTIAEATLSNVILYDAFLVVGFDNPVVKYPSRITVSSTKQVIVDDISGDDETTITAQLLTAEGVPAPNQTIHVEVPAMSYETDETTGSNGEITLDYTAIGVGRVPHIFTYHDTTETYTLYDVNFKQGVSTWYNHQNRITVTSNSDGSTTIKGNTPNTQCFYLAPLIPVSVIGGTISWTLPFTVEFDVINFKDFDTPTVFQIYDGTTTINRNLRNWDCKNKHVRVEITGTSVKIFVDDEEVPYGWTGTLSTSRVGFRVNYGCQLTFKNFIIYPTGE